MTLLLLYYVSARRGKVLGAGERRMGDSEQAIDSFSYVRGFGGGVSFFLYVAAS